MDAGLLCAVGTGDRPEDLEHRHGGSAGGRSAPSGECHDSSREFRHADAVEGSFQPVRDGRRRNDGGAEAGEGQRRQQADAIDFGLGSQGDAGVGRCPVEHATKCSTGGRQQQRDLVEVGERNDLAVGEGMAVGGEEQQVLGEQGLDDQLGVVDGKVHDGGVELPGEHVGNQRRRGSLLHDCSHVRIALAEVAEEHRHEPARGGADDTDAGLAGHFGVAARDVGSDVIEFVQDASCALDDPGPVLGQSTLGPIDECDAEFLLQPGDVARHVRLHGVQRSGRSRERAVIGDRHERGELAHIHLPERYQVSLCSTCKIACSRAYFHKQVAV